MNSASCWDSVKECTASMFERGGELANNGIGTPMINDFQSVVMIALIQTHRYIRVPCNEGERLIVDDQTCFHLEGFKSQGVPFGPGDKFVRQFVPGLTYEASATPITR